MQQTKSISKRLLAVMLSLAMVFSLVQGVSFNASATNDSDIVLGSNGKLTRAEWLHNLVYVFEMIVDEEGVPDNYYSDLDESHEYYEDILLATEFGVVNLEAGEPLYPDAATTRDFAASTLNFCLGYQLDEGTAYSFADYAECTDPKSAQIAVDRGWLELIGGNFYPANFLTSNEAQKMLDDAVASLEKNIVDATYNSTFELADDVVIIPEGTMVEEGENGKLSITDCPQPLAVGDTFAVYQNGIPVVYKAIAVSITGQVTTIETQEAISEDVFTSIDAEGVIESGAMEVVPAEGVELTVDEELASSYALRNVKKLKTFTLSKNHNFGALNGNISLRMANPYVEYSIAGDSVYVALCGQATITFNFQASFASATGLGSITLGSINIGGVGSLDIAVNADLSGSATGSVEGGLVVGLSWQKNDCLRAVRSFKQTASYTNVEGEAKVSLKATLGVTKLPIVKAYVYAEIGVLAKISVKTYADDKKPHQCTHFSAYLFAKYGASASANFIGLTLSQSVSNNIFSESNSPYRVVHHYEDGRTVASCTRGQDYSKFFTKGTSRWSGCGWISADGAYGLNADGTYFALYTYTINEDNKATITKYNGNSWSVYIPTEIDGYAVVAIGNKAFQNKNVGFVSIPDSVTSIGYYAFYNCSNLSSVTLSENLVSLGYSAFYNCDSLTSIKIPKSLNEGGYNSAYPSSSGAFNDCDNLKNVTFEAGITDISRALFANCYGIKEITIPDTVTIIENDAFYNCKNLSRVTLSKNLVSLGYSAFENCDSLTSIKIPKSLKNTECSYVGGYSILVGSYVIGVGTLNNKGPFAYCDNLREISFEEGATSVPNYLFAHCYGIEKVEIPYTVTNIGIQAFDKCSNLRELSLYEGLTSIGECAFGNCESLEDLSLPESVTQIDAWAFANCNKLETIELPNRLTSLGGGAFCYCSNLSSIVIPKSLTKITEMYLGGYNAGSCLKNGGPFMYCEKLNNVTFEDGVSIIPSCLFAYCNGLKNIEIPKTVVTIEQQAFDSCSILESVVFNSGLKTIENDAFTSCSSLKSIVIPDSVMSMGTYIFAGCSSLESVTLPNSRVNIAEGLFKNCISLKSIELQITVQNIRKYAFQNSGLTEINLPKNVALIEDYAFQNCASLKEVILPEAVTSVGNYAFQNCVALEKVKVPKSTKTIGSSAFMGCERLSNVDIADYSITTINGNTFKDCPSLSQIVLPKGLTTIGSQVFMNDTSLVNVTIPESVTSIDSSAFSYPLKTTIYGKIGSYAETFANNGGFTFKDNSIPVEGIITKDGVENVVLDRGESYRAEFEVYPEDANDVITLTASNNNVTISGHDIYARYAGDTVITATATSGLTYQFNIHIRSVNNIKVIAIPTKTTYIMGEKFDKSGMVVQVNYNDGTSKLIDDYTISGFDSSVEGDCDVTVEWTSAYGYNYYETFTVQIVDPTPKLTGIYIDTLPTKLNYELREALDVTGLVVKGSYTDNSTKEITDYTLSGYNALKNGAQTITVMHGDFTTSFSVSVGQVTLRTISVAELPEKVEYYIGEALNTTGLQLLLTYSDGTTATVSGGFAVSGFDSSTVGTKTVTITYDGASTTFLVTVSQKSIDDTPSDDINPPIDGINCTHTGTIVIDKAVAATCEKAGLTEGKHCSVCSEVIVAQKEVAKTEHKNIVTDKAVSPTCEKAGKTVGSHCKDCGTVIKAQTVVKAKGHSTTVKNKKSATYFAKGYSGDTVCKVCNKTITKGKATAKKTLKKPTVKVTAGKKQIKVKYTKTLGATGFEVQYKIGKKTVTKNFSTKKSATKSITKLAKGTYKVKVRALVKSGKNKAYSKWTKTYTAKVK